MNSPSISALVVAHNEEILIEKCIRSILDQSVAPDEIVIIAHNCTDKTEEIVSKYNQIKLISYQGPAGHIYARIKGFESVTGEIVVCTDGDSFVERNWIEKMTRPLQNQKVSGVGGVVIFTNILSRRFSVASNFYLYWLIGFVHKSA
jgi:biofilm PGA synthesis N-glycosyltransferase PgaC